MATIFADNNFLCIFINENVWISNKISLKYVPHGPIDNKPSYILSSVWVRLSIFSPLSIIQYVGLYVFSLLISLVMIEKIYILCLIIIIKSEVWAITHCLGLGHETMVSAVCLSIFFLLIQVMGWHQSGDKPLSEPKMVWFTDTYMHHWTSIT